MFLAAPCKVLLGNPIGEASAQGRPRHNWWGGARLHASDRPVSMGLRWPKTGGHQGGQGRRCGGSPGIGAAIDDSCAGVFVRLYLQHTIVTQSIARKIARESRKAVEEGILHPKLCFGLCKGIRDAQGLRQGTGWGWEVLHGGRACILLD